MCPDLSPAQGTTNGTWTCPELVVKPKRVVKTLVLSRKPEASLHLQTGKREGKAPHCPLFHTEGLLLMEGQE